MLVPKLRFKREDGTDYPEWEKQRIGDLFYKGNERNNGQFDKTKWISVAKMYYQVPDKVTSNNIDTRTYVMRIGDMAFEGHPNSDFLFGRFVVNDIGDGVISELFPIYRHKTEYVLKYWKYAIQIEKVMAHIYRRSITSSGVSSNKLNDDDFQRESICVPCLEEQQKIADFLSTVDEVIAQSEAEVQNLEQQKKAAMQKIFSQEVRFKREDGTDYPEWEEKPFVSFCDVITEQTGFDYTKTIKRALLTEQKDGTLPYLQTKNFTRIKFDYSTDYYIPIEVANQFERIILDRKCLLFSIVGASVGNIALFPNTVKCFLSRAICVAKPIKEEWTAYLYHFMCSELGQSQIRNATKGSVQATITIEDIRAFSIKTPCLEEQKKIADFRSAYDEAISYAKQELDKWKELKKGLLQQMFV